MSLPVLAPSDIFAGRYRVGRALAEGGLSTLHVVEHIDTGEQRLLQRIPADQIAATRIDRELMVWARAAGGHGASLLDSGHDGGVAWLVWALIKGESLLERVQRSGPLGPEEARSVIVQLGDALAALHTEGVIQRDLRPEAILIERASSRVYLTGHLFAERLAAVGQELWGSAVDELSWIAPEQLNAEHHGISPATNVWSFALIAFYALTGHRYWQGTQMTELAREMLIDPLPPASVRAAELGFTQPLPSGFDAWFAACLVRDTSARLADMSAATRAFTALFSRFDMSGISPGNPGPPHYDDGIQDPPPSQPGGYRGGIHGRGDRRRDDIILANPKGSFYDRGLSRNPRRWPLVIVPVLLVLGVLWAIFSRRH